MLAHTVPSNLAYEPQYHKMMTGDPWHRRLLFISGENTNFNDRNT